MVWRRDQTRRAASLKCMYICVSSCPARRCCEVRPVFVSIERLLLQDLSAVAHSSTAEAQQQASWSPPIGRSTRLLSEREPDRASKAARRDAPRISRRRSPAMHRAHEAEPFVSCPPSLYSALFAHKQECIDIGRRTNTLVLIKKDGVAITRNPRARAGPVYAAAAREVQSWIDREIRAQAKELQAWLTDFTAIDEKFGLEVLKTVSANANPLDILATYRADLVASYTLSTEHKQLITVPGTLGLYAPPRLPFMLHKSDQDAGAMPKQTSPSAHAQRSAR